MSEYNLAYVGVENMAEGLSLQSTRDAAQPNLRAWFKHHLRLVAEAMHACECNDSGKTAAWETEALHAVATHVWQTLVPATCGPKNVDADGREVPCRD